MKKNLLLATFVILSLVIKAQKTSKWSDLFSYNNVLAIREDSDRLVAATENGIFYYNPSSGEIKKLSKANGLHDVKITAFDYNPETRIGLVGYKNGGMDVITPNGIFYIVDIPIANGYIGDKRINHISIKGDQAIISVGYGVSIFNLGKREFGDTSFFSTAGTFTMAKEAGIVDNTVYVATNNGIIYHEINTTFPVFSSWKTLITGNFTNVASKDILAYSDGNQVRYGNPNSMTPLPRNFNDIKDVVINQQKILVADNTAIYQFSVNGVLEQSIDYSEKVNTGTFYNNNLYTGSLLSGILDKNKSSYKPDGPYNNSSYKISLLGSQLWISSGGRDDYDLPINSNMGYYHFDGNKWIYPEYFKNNPISFNILDVVPNPSNPSEVFFANYAMNNGHKGIYKMKNNEFVKSYKSNEGRNFYYRPTGIAFDDANQLFVSVSLLDGAQNVGYYFYDKAKDDFITIPVVNGNRVQKPFIKDKILYIPCPREGAGGLAMYEYNNPAVSGGKLNFLTSKNNLATSDAVSAAVDKNDNLWIGTRKGLRTLSNPKSAILEASPQTDPIVIEQNGLGEELFRDAEILQIAVDSGNHKWVSTAGGGVFFISPNGEQTYSHFNKANSPLPNDIVTDVQVDDKTGKVYFVTLDGVVVYQGDVANVSENFGDVLVYPNPVVYSQFKGNVRIKGLAAKTNIRITDAAGNVVHSAVARGGYYEWNLNNQRGVRVASGVYFVLMTNEDGTDKATAKIAIVN